MKIAFFDSGIGGLTVLHEAQKLMPDEDYLFYADTAHVPYGEKSKEQVRAYVLEAARFIAGQDVKALVVSCNTATSIAIEDLRRQYRFPVIGIEPAVKPAVAVSRRNRKKVLVVATALTLKEVKFHQLVERLDNEDVVDCLPLPGLVRLAEQFCFDRARVLVYLREATAALQLSEYGTVVLGCTHFPFFKDSIQLLFPEGTAIVDGSIGTVRQLQHRLQVLGQLGGGSGIIDFYRSSVKVNDPELLQTYQRLLQKLDNLY
ncbi:MAG: glutamate racemase [Sporolactobacillus sp.]